MKYRYLFTLEVAPLEVGKTYDELPSHLTLMSRFLSELSVDKLAEVVRPLFSQTGAVELVFGEVAELGPKKLMVHIVVRTDELKKLHVKLCSLLNAAKVEYEYPQFIGDNHKPHVTLREEAQFVKGDKLVVQAVYLIEIVDKKRVVRAKFDLGE